MLNRFLATALILTGLFAFSSCQKEVNLPKEKPENLDAALVGNWKFIESHITSQVIDEVSSGGFGKIKSVSNADYSTINNKGSLTIEETKILSKQIGYDVATVVKADFYQDDVFVESGEAPFNVSIAPSSSVTNYKRIGTDSLYFENGSFGQFEGTPDGVQSKPAGVKYRIEGATLFLTSVANDHLDDYSTGVHRISSSTATIVTTLEKQ